MTRFAKALPVYFWEEPIPHWEAASTGNGAPGLNVKRHDDGVTVIRPVLPEGTTVADATRMQAVLLRDFVKANGIKRPVFWFYSPFLLGIVGRLKPALSVYDCMDELSAFRFAPAGLQRQERRMMQMADVVFTGGHSLYEAKLGLHHNVHAFPSSVDVAHFAPARQQRVEPDDQAGIPHPRLGYFGVIDERIDQGLIARVAAMRPDLNIIMLGPVVKVDPELLPQRANIHYLGQKPYADLPSYVGGWDVAMMPFALNDATKFISPTKTPEYLACGRPVVSTPIKDVVRTYGGLEGVRIAATPAEFVAEVDAALVLAATSGKWRSEADELLAAGSWDRTWDAMMRLMRAAAAKRRSSVKMPIVPAPPGIARGVKSDVEVSKLDPADRPAFKSFFMGGFEGSSHRLADGRQLDLIASTRHDVSAKTDYDLMASNGLGTIRDALRWHLIETTPHSYDWSSFLPMLRASGKAGLQVIWDLCHYGIPHDVDIWSPAFVERYAAFAAAAARVVRDETDGVAFYCPMNEISYWAWAGATRGLMYPAKTRRGDELKKQLARAAIAAIDTIRSVDPGARFIQAEPLINVVDRPRRGRSTGEPGAYHLAQYDAYDMIAGRLHPELGGSPAHLDIIGSNFYFDNQWMASGERLSLGHPSYRPLSDLLAEVHLRYQRPIILSETGAEAGNGPGWLRYVAGEVRGARDAGIPVDGICLYPIMDYPGWVNGRHCRCGLIQLDANYATRQTDQGLLEELARQRALLFDADRQPVPLADGRAASLMLAV